jgi:hypothetical protein
MADAGLIGGIADLHSRLAATARHTLNACNLKAAEQLLVLTDSATAPELTRAFTDAATASDHSGEVVLLSVSPRQPAFADLPPLAVDALLAADLVIDLATVPWLYSDSFTRYGQECGARGSRLALIWGMPESLRTLAACPPSATLANRARRALPRLNDARTLRVRSTKGTDFHAELGDPLDFQRSFIGEPPTSSGMIGAPLCASVTAPLVAKTAHGTLAFVGAGRFQGPENFPIRTELPVTFTVEAGRVVDVQGDHAAGVALADWFARAHHDDVFVLMDCNIGFDPRAELAWADNTVVHSFAGGIMIGFGNPYQYRPEGSHRPGYHLDLMFPGVDVDLDETPFIRAGSFAPDAGIG